MRTLKQMEPPLPPRYSEQLRDVVALDQRFRTALARALDLNPSALDAMEWLMREGPLTAGDLAARVGLTPGGVTGILKRLESTGHAHREADPLDARSLRVVPNPASVEGATALLMPLITHIGQRTASYTPDEMATIERFLDDVAAAYRHGIDALEEPDRR